MTDKKNLPDFGDVITSSKFAYGYYDTNREIVTVDGITTTHPVTSRVSEDERVAEAARSGKIPPVEITVEFGTFDLSRGEAKFVVEEAKEPEYGIGDAYKDDWHVRARRLYENGTYNPEGEIIQFSMSQGVHRKIGLNDVMIVGKMRMIFV